jgi:hypothetical protein
MNEPGTSRGHWKVPRAHYPDVKVDMPFPTTTELLEWSMVKRLVEKDTSADVLEESFGEVREEFDRAVVEWRDKVERDVFEIWRAGWNGDDGPLESHPGPSTGKSKPPKGKATKRTGTSPSVRKPQGGTSTPGPSTSSDRIDSSISFPEFTVTFTKPDGTTTTDVSELPRTTQILLRANTSFILSDQRYTYPSIVPSAPPALPFGLSGSQEIRYGKRWDPSTVTWDNEGSAIAQVLLERLGCSDATSAEMKAIGHNLRCGRCDFRLPDRWEDLVRAVLLIDLSSAG